MTNTHPQTCSQCWGNPFHQHCERDHYEYDSKNINTTHKSGMSNPQTFMAIQQQQQTNFVHVFPSDIEPRFLKNLPHSRVRFWPCHHLGNGCRNKYNQQIKTIIMNNRTTNNNKKNHVQLAAHICTAVLALPGHNPLVLIHPGSSSRMLILPGYNAVKSLALNPLRPKTLEECSDMEPFFQGIESLRWICWVNLEPQTWLFSQLSSSNQIFTLDGSATLDRVRPRPAHSLRCAFTGPQPLHSRISSHHSIGFIRRSYDTRLFHCAASLLQQGTMRW